MGQYMFNPCHNWVKATSSAQRHDKVLLRRLTPQTVVIQRNAPWVCVKLKSVSILKARGFRVNASKSGIGQLGHGAWLPLR